MTTDTHEFYQEIYSVDDQELQPPKSRYVHPNPNYNEPLKGPWTFVALSAISGHASGLFNGGRKSHVVVVWARPKQ